MSDTANPSAAPRRFEYSEGGSHKFWSVHQDGSALAIRFGRIGTEGQSQDKTFASEQDAANACAKLIGEKTRKGYTEIVDRVTAAPAPRPSAISPAATRNTAKATAPSAEAAPAPAAPTASRIALEPLDWFRAPWRDLPPLPRPAAPAFDLKDGLTRLAKVKVTGYGWQWDWTGAAIRPVLSPEEGRFWFAAMCKGDMSGTRAKITPRDVAAQITEADLSAPVRPEQIAQILGSMYGAMRPEAMAVLWSQFPLVSLLPLLVEAEQDALAASLKNKSHYYYRGTPGVREGLRRYVIPYLSPDERQAARDAVCPHLALSQWPTHFYESPPLAIYLAALFGLSEELRPLVEGWPDDLYRGTDWDHTHYHRPQEIVFGLGSAALVEAQMRRLKLPLSSPDDVRAWLAHTEDSALDYVRDNILANTNKDEAAALTDALALAETPRTAPAMLDLMLVSRAPRPARLWLEDHPAQAVMGLAPVAGGRGKTAEPAAEFLRSQKRQGRDALIESAVAELPADAAERVRAEVLRADENARPPFDETTTPDWLREAVAGVGLLKMTWAKGPDLPPIVVGEHRLNDQQIAALLAALAGQKSPQSPAHPLVTAVKGHAEPSSCDAFAWQLFERWLRDGAPSKERWALIAVGLLGGDASALKLTPLVRAWPGESQHGRAVLGLETLRAIGTDTALMQINGIAQKIPFKGLKASAIACLEGIAQDRGLTRAQLEDRIVPDCDLDGRGSRVFDFGPRRFRFVLGPDMKPMVRDADGTIKPDLPKPNAKDDSTLAESAVAEWKLLKKQIAEVAKVQSARLEQAIVTGRRWPREEFETLLVRHPLMTNLTRLLVWGVWDSAGSLTGAFRVTEDQTYADGADDTYSLPTEASVGLVHPLQLTPEQRAAWGEVFGDYELVPPFPQIGRALHALAPEEVTGTDITRFAGIKIPAASVVFGLDKREWMRGLPADGGGFNEHTKPFYGAGVTAVVQYEEGVGVGYITDAPDQKMTAAFFIPGVVMPHEWWPAHKDRLPLAGIDPVVISEVLADLTAIAAKAK